MSEVGANGPLGKFVWYEYMGDDLEGAAAFYAKVVGWGIAEGDMTDFPYKIASAGGARVAGLMKIPPEAKAMGARHAGPAMSGSPTSTPRCPSSPPAGAS